MDTDWNDLPRDTATLHGSPSVTKEQQMAEKKVFPVG